jgi:hypothetical protein
LAPTCAVEGEVFNVSHPRHTFQAENKKKHIVVNGNCIIVAVGSSGILKAKQKLGVTFDFDMQDFVVYTKFSKMTMCRASEANA